jgi:class 3 adenylate cyclase
MKFNNEDISKIVEFQKNRDSAILAILFTDIVDYSSLVNNIGDNEAYKIISYYEKVILQIVDNSNGIIVKKIGDSFLAVFTEPSESLKVALTIQNKLSTDKKLHNIIKSRIGIHLGQVIFDNNFIPDIFGNHVNIASRIMSLSKGNQILVSKSIYENTMSWLKKPQNAKKYNFKYFIRTKLKGIKDKYDLYEIFNSSLGSLGSNYKIILKRFFKYTSILMLITLSIISFFLFSLSNSNNDNDILSGDILFEGVKSNYAKRYQVQNLILNNDYGYVAGMFMGFNAMKSSVENAIFDTLSLAEVKYINSKVITNINKLFYPSRKVLTTLEYKDLFNTKGTLPPPSFLDNDKDFAISDIFTDSIKIIEDKEQLPIFENKTIVANTKLLMDSLNISYIFKYNIYKFYKDKPIDYMYILESSYMSYNNDTDSGTTNTSIAIIDEEDLYDSIESSVYELVYSNHHQSNGKVIEINDKNILVESSDSLNAFPLNIMLDIFRVYNGDDGINKRKKELVEFFELCKIDSLSIICLEKEDIWGDYLYTIDELNDLKENNHKIWINFNDTLSGLIKIPG